MTSAKRVYYMVRSLHRWTARLYHEDMVKSVEDMILYGRSTLKFSDEDFQRRSAAFPWCAPKVCK